MIKTKTKKILKKYKMKGGFNAINLMIDNYNNIDIRKIFILPNGLTPPKSYSVDKKEYLLVDEELFILDENGERLIDPTFFDPINLRDAYNLNGTIYNIDNLQKFLTIQINDNIVAIIAGIDVKTLIDSIDITKTVEIKDYHRSKIAIKNMRNIFNFPRSDRRNWLKYIHNLPKLKPASIRTLKSLPPPLSSKLSPH